MLSEPDADAERDALDAGLMAALAARAALPPAPADGEAIRRRTLLAQAPDAATARTLRLVWDRLDALGRPAPLVWGPQATLAAADRQGPAMRAAAEPEAALAGVVGRTRAWLDLSGRAWWGRLLARPGLGIAAAWPDDALGRPRVLVVSAEAVGPTGEDRSFWVTDSPWPDGRVVEALGRAGLAAEPLAASGGLKLFMLAGYVQREDGRLDGAPGELTGVIGAAPVY